jgi:hypothetical protein
VSTDAEDLLLDRPAISALSVEELGPGARITVSRIDKLAMHGMGPPVDATLGPKHLTKRRNARVWLRTLIRPRSESSADEAVS